MGNRKKKEIMQQGPKYHSHTVPGPTVDTVSQHTLECYDLSVKNSHAIWFVEYTISMIKNGESGS